MKSRMNGFIPNVIFLKLEAWGIRFKLSPQINYEHQGHQAGCKGKPAMEVRFPIRQKQHDQRSEGRDEQDQAQEMVIEKLHAVLLRQQEEINQTAHDKQG